MRRLAAGLTTGLLMALLTLPVLAQPRPQLDEAQAALLSRSAWLGDWVPAPLPEDPSVWTPQFVVAADGSGSHRTVQAALDALPPRGAGAARHYILLRPGVYRETLCVRDKAPFTLYGLGAAEQVLIVAGRYAAQPKRPDQPAQPCVPALGAEQHGTPGSSTAAIFSDEVQLLRLTIANDAMDAVRAGQGYPAGAGESGGAQAVALMTRGDRIQLQQVRLLGHQDTFYAERAPQRPRSRVLVERSLIAGDVDFIFGGASLLIDHSLILSRAGRRSSGQGGHVLAPSTPPDEPHGFLVQRSRLLGEAGLAPQSISLGRAWDHGVAKGQWQQDLSPNGQALLRDNLLGPHLGPWAASTSRRPFAAQGPAANRLAEFRNHALPAAAYEGLPAEFGWAAAEGGTRGGADAAPEQVLAVRNRAELDAALALGERPKIIALLGRIDLAADAASARRLGAEDFRDPAFDWAAYAAAPEAGGAQDQARRRSARRQAAQVVLRLPSNTTLIGLGPDAGFEGGMLLLERVSQIILRHLRLSDAYDHFPAWDPRDNGHGEWNSEYDNLSLRGARHVWVDHCTLDDGQRADAAEPLLLGQRLQRHDGLLDITQQSDLVTVSWSHFRRHDKTMLIGAGDGQSADAGRLRVSLFFNLWDEVKERAPRVRYGQVHLMNNLYRVRAAGANGHGYSLGLGWRSELLAEANAWDSDRPLAPRQILRWFKASRFEDRGGSLLNGAPLDLQALLREGWPEAGVEPGVSWRPPYAWPALPAAEAAAQVRAGAGAAPPAW